MDHKGEKFVVTRLFFTKAKCKAFLYMVKSEDEETEIRMPALCAYRIDPTDYVSYKNRIFSPIRVIYSPMIT